MNAFLGNFGAAAGLWQEIFWPAAWQGAIVLAAAWAIARWCTFLSPRVVCWIWRLACLKLLIALLSLSPIDLPWLPAGPAPPAVAHVEAPTVSHWGAPNEPQNPGADIAFTDRPAVSSLPPISIVACLMLAVWLIGVVFFMNRTLRQWRAVRRLRVTSQSCTTELLPKLLAEEAARLGVQKLPALRSSGQLQSPLLIGFVRPTIILPAQAIEKFDEPELRLMIAHELAHQKRHDLAWNWLPTLCGWLFFFHPLVWLMLRRWSQAQEAACDELLIQRHAAEPAQYGRLLVKLATGSAWESGSSLATAGVLGAYRNLEQRILLMSRVRPFSSKRLAVAAGVLAIAAGAIIIPWRLVAAEPKVEEAEEPVPVNAYFVGRRASEPAPDTDPATLKAMTRLRELGAAPVNAFGKGISIGIQSGWKGTAEDLNLLADLTDLRWLYFNFEHVSAASVGEVLPKLKQPLDFLGLELLNDERVAALGQLPKCRNLMLGQASLTAAGFARLAKQADGVESLDINGEVDDPSLAAIARIGSVKEIHLNRAKITAAGLASLAALDHLNKLVLFQCRGISPAGYAQLAPVKSLRELWLLGPRIDAETTAALAKLPQLEGLVLQPLRLPEEGLKLPDVEALAQLKNLRTLSIMPMEGRASETARLTTGSALSTVAGQLPALRTLSLMNILADSDALAALAGAKDLEELTLMDAALSDASLASLGQLKNLKQLKLGGNGVVNENAWVQLTDLKQLTMLSLDQSGLDDASLAQLAGLSALEQLNLPGSKVTGSGLAALANLKEFKSLYLAGSPVTDEGAKSLRELQSLAWLDLSGTKITDPALDTIAALPALVSLNLDNTQLTADGLLKLSGLKKLSRLAVSGLKLSDEDLTRLRTAMPEVQFVDQSQFGFTTMSFTPDRGDVKAPPAKAEPPAEDDAAGEPIQGAVFLDTMFIGERPHGPKAVADPAVNAALKRLEELGGYAMDQEGGLLVNIQGAWKGTDADLALLDSLGEIKQLTLDLDAVDAEAVGKLKLKQTLPDLDLRKLTDERVAAMEQLPKCIKLMLPEQTLSAQGFRRLAALADGVEFLIPSLAAGVDDERLAGICQIKSLKELWLQQAEITDAGVASLAGLDQLAELSLFNCTAVHGAGYGSLSGAKSLRVLRISGVPIDAAGFRALATLTQLREFVLAFVPGQNPADLALLKNLPHLESLQVIAGLTDRPPTVGNAVLAAAAAMPALRNLHLTGFPTDADGLTALARAPHLEVLNVAPLTLSDPSVAALAELKNLKKLTLFSSEPVPVSALPKLGQLKPLTSLWLSNSGLDDAGLAQLAPLTGLTNLDLAGSKVTGAGLKSLTNCRQLESLNLSHTLLGDAASESLRNFPALRSLDLSQTKITDRSLDAIAALPNLQMLTLNQTRVTAAGLLKLKDLKRLSALYLVGVKLPAKDLAELRAAMPEVQIASENSDWTLSAIVEPEPEGAAAATAAAKLAKRGRLADAFAELEKAHEKEPTLVIDRAAVQLLNNHPGEATAAQKNLVDQWLTAAIQKAPDSLELQLIRADFLDVDGRFEDSAKLYRELIARPDMTDGQRAAAQNNLAYRLVTLGKKDDLAEARTLIDAAIGQFGPIGSLLDTRGLIHLAQGDDKAALADFVIAVGEAPTAMNYFHLALAEEKAGNAAGAVEAFRKAAELRLDPKQLVPAEQRDYQRLKEAAAKREKP